MTTQSNKQTQSVKVVVNNNTNCCDKPKPRRRRKPAPRQEEAPPPDMMMPPLPPMKEFARGLPAYPIRPTLFAPTTQMIQPENGLTQLPAYFDKQFTNQQATLEEIQRSLRHNYEELATQLNALSPANDDEMSSAVWNAPPSALPSSPLRPASPLAPPPSQRTPNTGELEAQFNDLRNAVSASSQSTMPQVQIPPAEEVPDIIRNIINPQRQVEDIGSSNSWRDNSVERAFGENHPYNLAFRLFREGANANRTRKAQINAEIREIGQQHGIQARYIYQILRGLASLP